MNTKNIVSSIVISVVVVFLGFTIFGGKTETIVKETIREIGASATTNEIVGTDEFIVNGIKRIYRKKLFTSATTTPCSIPFPNGTSTPVYFSVNNAFGTSTAMIYDVSTSSTAYATSSSYNWIHQRSVAAGAWDRSFVLATTSASERNADGSFKTIHSSVATTTYFVLKTGAGQGGYTLTGASCQAEFIQIAD